MLERKQPKPGRPQGSKTFDPALALAFGAALKARRIELGLSQEELAAVAGIERAHASKLERGEHLPNFVLVIRLARALGVTPGKLVDRAVDLL